MRCLVLRPRIACLSAALLLVAACGRNGPATARHDRAVMGTFAELTAIAPDDDTAQQAVAAGYARLDKVNALMSDYVAESEIGRLNDLPPEETLALSTETFACLEAARAIAERSGGAFDITCRPLVKLWKTAGQTNRLPSDEEVAAARERVGWDKLVLDPDEQTATKTVAGMTVDLGGIAKGYGLDLAADAMRAAGATSGLVNVGGDVLAFGDNVGQPWRVGVRHPFREGRYCRLAIVDRAVATSGVQQRFSEIEGRRYSHIVDPRTGWPAEQAPSVTVIAADGRTADAWATVFSVLTVAEGRDLIADGQVTGLEVLWIWGSAENVQTAQTPGFANYILKTP
jgi:thiamine biosynthesis lipoprotein